MSTIVTHDRVRSFGLLLTILGLMAEIARPAENGRITFEVVYELGYSYNVYSVNPDGTGTSSVLNPGWKPKYSPDGRLIAYYGGLNEVWIAKSDGSDPRKVVSPGNLEVYHRYLGLSWSPDGERIAYTCAEGICTIRTDGTGKIVVSKDIQNDAPEWSPDGTKFAFLRRPFQNCNHECWPDIFVMNADGTGQNRITAHGEFTYVGDPEWSPDGAQIAFTEAFALFGWWSVIIAQNDGSNPRFLVGGGEAVGTPAIEPAWSPDGTKIAFAGDPSLSQKFISDIYVINVDGTNLRNLTQSPGVPERNPDWGTQPALPISRTPFDIDSDGKTDISVFRPSETGIWYLNLSTDGIVDWAWGSATDLIVPADYDADGRTDISTFRPSDGQWVIINSSTWTFTMRQWGVSTDIPVPGDFDGDARADIAIFRPMDGRWWISRTMDGTLVTQFGQNGDRPVVGDYDGDGRSDVAVYRPADGIWYMSRSTAGITGYQWGLSADKVTPADYDGDGKTDIAVYRPSEGRWYIANSSGGHSIYIFGAASDIPVPGDYDGDGRADIAIFRPSDGNWWIDRTTTGPIVIPFGQNGDWPVPAAFIR